MQQFATGMYLDYNQARLLAWGYGGGGGRLCPPYTDRGTCQVTIAQALSEGGCEGYFLFIKS